MRIYFMTHAYPPLVGSLPALDWAASLHDAGFHITTLSPQRHRHGWSQYERDPDLEIVEKRFTHLGVPIPEMEGLFHLLHHSRLLACPQTVWGWQLNRWLGRQLKTQPGLVLVHYPIISSVRGAAKAAKKHHCPLAIHMNDVVNLAAIEQELKQAAFISVNSEGMKHKLRTEVQNLDCPIEICHDGWAGIEPKVKVRNFLGKLTLIFSDPLEEAYHPEWFAQAWHLLIRSDPDLASEIMINFTGQPGRYAKKMLLPLLRDGNLECTGFLPWHAEMALRCRSDIAVSAGHRQTIYNHLACALPILVLNPEDEENNLIRNHALGTIIMEPTPEAIAEALKQFLLDRQTLRRCDYNTRQIRGRLTIREQVTRLARHLYAIAQV